MTRTTSFALSIAVAAALLLPLGASGQTSNPTPQCQSKWVAAGNNGAKADRYYRPACQ